MGVSRSERNEDRRDARLERARAQAAQQAKVQAESKKTSTSNATKSSNVSQATTTKTTTTKMQTAIVDRVEISDAARKAQQNAYQNVTAKTSVSSTSSSSYQNKGQVVAASNKGEVNVKSDPRLDKIKDVEIASDKSDSRLDRVKDVVVATKPNTSISKAVKIDVGYHVDKIHNYINDQQKNIWLKSEKANVPNPKNEYLIQEKKVDGPKFEGIIGEIDYVSASLSRITGGGGASSITLDKNGKVYAGVSVGIGYDNGVSAKVGYLTSDKYNPKTLLVGNGVNESIQTGNISVGLSGAYPSPNKGPMAVEIGGGGKVPLGGSMTYGTTVELFDTKKLKQEVNDKINKAIEKVVDNTIEKVKDIFKPEKDDKKNDKEKNVIDRIKDIFRF